MSQRIKRAQERKNDGSTFNTGGYVVHHDRDEQPVVRVPQKTTGDVPAEKLSGVAKASPFFKKLDEPVKPKNKQDEKKVIAEAVEKVLDDKDDTKDSQ